MKANSSGFWRSFRWLVALVLAGGAAFAVENSRTDLIHGDRTSILDWFSSFSWDEEPARGAPPRIETVSLPQLSLATNQFLHPALYSPPATGWRFQDPAEESRIAWQSQQSAPVITGQNADYRVPTTFFSGGSPPVVTTRDFIVAPNGGPPPPPGFWIANASGNWSTPTNWQGGVVPSGSTAAAHFDTLDITNDVTVTLDTSRLIGELDVGDTNGTHRYDIAPGSSGQRIVFDSNTSTSILHQSSTSAGDTISVPLSLNNDLLISNASTTNPLQISGDITANRPVTGSWQITFTGTVNVSGNITPGTTGGDLSLNISGNVNLSGTNTYGGSTFVTGSLFVKGDNSGADGFVQVSGGGSLLSGIGKVGGIVTIFGGTITGGSTTTVGTLTLLQSVSISASEGGGGTYLANLDGTTSDLLKITGTLNIGSGTTLDIHGTADGTTTYILATFLGGGLSGTFDFVTGLPADYELVYTSSDIELVPTAVPEPATWIGGAAAGLSVIGYWLLGRRRRRSRVIS